MSDVPLKVSVVISTKNEEKVLENCLGSIRSQTYTNYELIVVDNYSSDKTKEIATRFTSQFYLKGPERAAQRNYGLLEKANGEFGMYIDADMIITSTLIEECVKTLMSSRSVALYIPEIVLGDSLFAQVRRFERSFYTGTVIDACRFFRMSAFRNVGGFDEKIFQSGSGEDWDLDKRFRALGKCEVLQARFPDFVVKEDDLSEFCKTRGVIHSPSFVGVYHDESEDTIGSYLRKKYYYSKGFEGYIKKWGVDDNDIKKQTGLLYRLLIVFLVSPVKKKLIIRPDLFALLLLLRFATGLFVFPHLVLKKFGNSFIK